MYACDYDYMYICISMHVSMYAYTSMHVQYVFI